MNYLNPSPREKQEIIDLIVSYNPTSFQLEALARHINEHPSDIYPSGYTTPIAVSNLVERASQKGIADELVKNATAVITVSSMDGHAESLNRKSLDARIAHKFGNLFTDLLKSLDGMTDQLEDEQRNSVQEDLTVFEEKLRHKARFSESMQTYAMECKLDNSVLQRAAKKFGFNDYGKLKKKVRSAYLSILAEYPPSDFSADKRYKLLLEYLLSTLPDTTIMEDDVDDYLSGIIFDTASNCWIFNE